jgi:membrane dipeptidase
VEAGQRARVIRRFAGACAFGSATLVLGGLPARGAETTERPVGVIDLHVDLSYQHNYQGRAFSEGTGQFRSVELERAGVVGVVLPLYVPRRASPAGARVEDFESSYAKVYGALATTSPYRLPGCIPRNGGVRTWFAFEGAGPLAREGGSALASNAKPPERLLAWAARGVRVFGPVHTFHNELASSSGDAKPADVGLSERGRELVREAVRRGMAVDVSHASDRSTREILALAAENGAPVVATHSNARALADHPRNLADPELVGIAKSGGVVGVNFHSAFLSRRGKATLADAVRHVKYLVKLMGSDHVAIGSDFEGDINPPPELADVRGYQRLARELEKNGVPKSTVEAVFSTNALRVLCRTGDRD